MTIPIWTVGLSDGDVEHCNIRFASSTLPIGADFVGGSNEGAPASKSFYLFMGSADLEKRWLYGDKKIFNNRTGITRRFFQEINAKPGTHLRIAMPRNDILVIEKA